MPCAQMLLYPVLDARMETESYKRFTDTPMCNTRDMEKYFAMYALGPSAAPREWLSPAESASVQGLPRAYIETAVALSYAQNYPELCVLLDVPYDSEGSSIGVVKGNDALLAAVNEAIAAALADGSMDKFVAEANEKASGNVYEGLLDNYEG